MASTMWPWDMVIDDNSQDAQILDVDELIKIFPTLVDRDGRCGRGPSNHVKLADIDGSGAINLTQFIEFITNPAVAKHSSRRLRLTAFRAILVIGRGSCVKG
jgi:hypothetical protein